MKEKKGELQKRLEAMKKKFSKGESAFIIGFFEQAVEEAKKDCPLQYNKKENRWNFVTEFKVKNPESQQKMLWLQMFKELTEWVERWFGGE